MASRREYDVYIDGKGYFLLKRSDGAFQQGAASWRGTDPFIQQLGEEGNRSSVSLSVRGGAGGREEDGTERYFYGENVDTRSGFIQIGPEWIVYPNEWDTGEWITERWPRYTTIGPGESAAVQLNLSAARDVRCIGIMLGAAGALPPVFKEALADLDPGFVRVYRGGSGATPVEGAEALPQHGIAPGNWRPWESYGAYGKPAWFECLFTADETLAANEWICVTNDSAVDIYWPHSAPLKSPTTGFPTGRKYAFYDTSWTVYDSDNVADEDGGTPKGDDDIRRMPVVKTKRSDNLDGFIRDIEFFGSEFGDRLCIAAGNKLWVMQADGTLAEASPSGGFEYPILDIQQDVWGNKQGNQVNVHPMLFVTFPTGAVQTWDGQLAGAGWNANSSSVTVPLTESAHYLGVARGYIWKGEGAVLNGAAFLGENEEWNDNYEVLVGNPNTPILGIKEGYEGTVLVMKPEGIFQAFVVAATPAVGWVRPDLLVDLSGETSGRGFLDFWIDAAYYPLEHGLAEFGGGFYRDTWVRREDEGGTLVRVDSFDPYYGRFTAMHPTSRTFWLAKTSAYPDGLGWQSPEDNGDVPADPAEVDRPDESSRGLEIWGWDGRGFHQAISERRHFHEACLAMWQIPHGAGISRVFYGHGFEVRSFDVPSWTRDKAEGDKGQLLNTYDPTKNDTIPQPSNWTAGGDPPHLITSVVGTDKLDENKNWVGARVFYSQVNQGYPVMFDMYIRWYDGQDWQLMELQSPGTGVDNWKGPYHEFLVVPQTGPPVIDPVSPWCQLAISFKTDGIHDANEVAGAVNNIKVIGMDLYYDANPEDIVQYELAIAGADYQQLHVGARDNRNAEELSKELRALMDNERSVKYIDLYGDEFDVRVLNVTDQPFRQMKRVPAYAEGFQIETVIGVNLHDVTWP